MKIFKYGVFSFLILFSIGISAQTKSVPNSIITYLKTNYPDTPETSRHFIYNAIDLNGDNKDEYLVGLIGGDWCGSGGCTMLLFTNAMKLNTRMTVVEFPVYIGAPGGKEVTKGYSNIYIENRNGSVVKIAWNGKKYPTNPSIAPKADKKIINGKFKFLNIAKQNQFTF
jgi:hypothetical protein